MTSTVTAERLTVNPPPDDYHGGPINVLYQQTGDDRPAELKTCGTLAEAQAFAQTCVENGFLAGTLTFQAADHGPTQLQQLVDQEQADHEAAATIDDEPEPDDVDPADYTIERVAADGTTRTEHTDLTLAQADEKLNKMRCRNGATLRIVHGQEVVRVKGIAAATEPTHKIVFVQNNGNETIERAGTEPDMLDRFNTTPAPGSGHLELRTADGTVLDTKQPHVEPDPVPQPEQGEEPRADDVVDGDAASATIDEHLEATTQAVADIIDDHLEEQRQLVDPEDYQTEALQLDRIDGQTIDRIAFAFTGQIMLDRSDPADVKLFRSLTIGQDVTLQVEGMCAGLTGKGATNRDGDLDVVVGVRRIKVHTIYLPVTADEAA